MKQAEEKYKALFNSIDEGFHISELIYDEAGNVMDWRFLEVNAAFERQTGLYDIVGKLGSEVAPDSESYWLEAYDRVIKTGEPLRVENYNGATGRWYSAYASPAGDADQRQFLVVFADITERKKAEEVLLQHKEQADFALNLSDALRDLSDAGAIRAFVAQFSLNYFGADRCFFCELTATGVLIRQDACRDGLHSVAGVYALNGYSRLQAIIDEGLPFIVHDVNSDDRVDESLRLLCAGADVGSLLHIPVFKAGGVAGMLCVIQSRPRRWTAHEIVLAREAAERSWAALERNSVAARLRVSEEKYRNLFNSIDTGFCIIEVLFDKTDHPYDYRFLEANAAFERHTGLRDVIGKTIREFAPEHEAHWFEIYGRIARTGIPERFENVAAAIGFYYEVYALRVDAAAENQVCVMFYDITERRRRESDNAFLEEIDQELARLTLPGDIIKMVGERLGAYMQVDLCVFGDIDESCATVSVLMAWSKSPLPGLMEQHTYTLEAYATTEFIRACREGEAVAIRDTATDGKVPAGAWERLRTGAWLTIPFHHDKRWAGFISVSEAAPRDWRIDETELVRAIADRVFPRIERARAEEALRQANRHKDAFLAMLAHELRNPMAAIYNGLQLLAPVQQEGEAAAGPADPAIWEMLGRQTQHLMRMVDDLLDVNRISHGKITLRKEPTDLKELVVQAVSSVKEAFQHEGRALEVGLPAAALWLDGDAARLIQVVTNLLTNGLRYTGAGGCVWLTLQQRVNGAGKSEAVLRVQDNGIGLAQDQLLSIFDMFAQADNALARPNSGLGLGLTLVKQLVLLHGGQVEAQSAGPGKGSTFLVILPITDNIDALHRQPEATGSSGKATASILIIDDNADAAHTLRMLLERRGYRAHTCNSGARGIDAFRRMRPDVILLDISMPDLDGFATCKILREQPGGKDVAIFALTGYGQQGDREQAREAGFDELLVKPVELAILYKLLAER